MIPPRTIRILLYTAIIILFAGCAGTYPEFETEGCDPGERFGEGPGTLSFAELSMMLVEAVRDGEDTSALQHCIANVPAEELHADLATEDEKKAFWLNIYNAYVQILLLEEPELYEDRDSWFGYNFFSSPQVAIAGRLMSFDDIEHGIMRRSTHKLTLGYMQSFRVPDIEKTFWWHEVDPRIHFALNCGAVSCPYIAVFDPDRVEDQLDIAARNYLNETTIYDAERNKAKVTRLMSWFRGDFGGLDGATEMLREYGAIPPDVDPKLSFLEYDWTLELGNYQEL
jgi:hypothetical protein